MADVFLRSHGVARRIPVVTQKADGSKKVRGVDRFSENGTGFMERVKTQGIGFLVVITI